MCADNVHPFFLSGSTRNYSQWPPFRDWEEPLHLLIQLEFSGVFLFVCVFEVTWKYMGPRIMGYFCFLHTLVHFFKTLFFTH